MSQPSMGGAGTSGVISGSGSASFEMLRYPTERLPVTITSKWVRSRLARLALVPRGLAVNAPVPALWRAVEGIGGDRGWYSFPQCAISPFHDVVFGSMIANLADASTDRDGGHR